MNSMDVYSVRDLRNHSSRLMKDAEAGRMSIITKRGKPAILAIPFAEQSLRLGVGKDLALQLFENGSITLPKAARIAGLSVPAFMDLLARLDIPAVDYPADELTDEVAL
ncbi:MAG: type II toxin-antitoxin system prevent-host-death family antitoxin [Opitutales bacterium]